MEELALKYLGSIPKSTRAAPVAMRPLPPPVEDPGRRFMQGACAWCGVGLLREGVEGRRPSAAHTHIHKLTNKHPPNAPTVHLPDSNPRAFVYVSGRTPNRWGYMDGGKKLVDYLASVAPDVSLHVLVPWTCMTTGHAPEHPTHQPLPPNVQKPKPNKQADDAAQMRRHHPGFPFVSLLLIQEIMNRRLFSNIREKKQLTYDANFRCASFLGVFVFVWYGVYEGLK